MKKTIVFLLAMLMLTLTACGDKGSAVQSPDNGGSSPAPASEPAKEPAAEVKTYNIGVSI